MKGKRAITSNIYDCFPRRKRCALAVNDLEPSPRTGELIEAAVLDRKSYAFYSTLFAVGRGLTPGT